MKKQIVALVCAISMISIAGCGSEQTATVNDSSATTKEQGDKGNTEANEEPSVGMPNPIVEVSSDEDFDTKLGISLDTSYLSEEVTRSIISDEIAQVIFNVDNVNGETVECCFRATKNQKYEENVVENLAGIYSSNIDEPIENIMATDSGDEIVFRTYHDNDSNSDIASWNYNDTLFTLATGENMSQMQLAALYDASLIVVGANSIDDNEGEVTGTVVEPMEAEIDLTATDLGGTYYATIESVSASEDGTLMGDFSIYTMDLYDGDDIRGLKAGDTLIINDEAMIVDTIVEDEPLVLYDSPEAKENYTINGGLIEGGADFIEYENDTFRFFGMDDMATYTCQGTVTLPIAEDAQVVDHLHDFDGGDNSEDGITLNAGEFEQYCNDEYEGSFSYYSTSVKIENGVVVEIIRRFVP